MADLLSQLEDLAAAARRDVAAAADERALEDLRVRFLGKKGELSAVLRGMGQLSAEERPKVGEVANRVKAEVEALLDDARKGLEARKLEAELAGTPIDVTLPGRRLLPRGHRHPIVLSCSTSDAIRPHGRDMTDGVGRIGDVMLRQPGSENFRRRKALLVGGRGSILSDENRKRIAAIDKPMTLQVFTTPT